MPSEGGDFILPAEGGGLRSCIYLTIKSDCEQAEIKCKSDEQNLWPRYTKQLLLFLAKQQKKTESFPSIAPPTFL